jgi:lipoprotein-anchoring transpeptidase ErfK/SrfK
MNSLFFKLAAATALGLTLSACVPTSSTMNAGPKVKPGETILAEGAYAAQPDPQFNVAAVPEDKIPQQFRRQNVYYETDQPVGTIVINPSARYLYLVTGKNQALRYGIAVGRAGFQWSGEALIDHRTTWPKWTPPPEMIERSPEKAKWKDGQPGGPTNPLGARALYLKTNGVDYGYRIHGTPEWQSIGRNASSGCIRMINQDVMDLYTRVPDGTKVIVLTASGEMPKGLTLPPPSPKKKKVVAPVAPANGIPALTVLPPPVLTPASVAPAVPAAPAPATTAAPAAVAPATAVAPAPAVAAPAVAAPATPAPATCAAPAADGSCPPAN